MTYKLTRLSERDIANLRAWGTARFGSKQADSATKYPKKKKKKASDSDATSYPKAPPPAPAPETPPPAEPPQQ